ncbi:DEKNAAC104566 [Brettanomyces naardenensis]|uniref:DEKNAAC104566 n=1 Tax=Brettanomyces naardenensis TaxID=13370 RepID=A0A448YRE8_BRENA|nr:DEKNAAC104566 [Brettanomyces naardenensis]
MPGFQTFKRFLSLRTTINPTNGFKLIQPVNHESIVLLTTPSQLNRSIEMMADLQQKNKNLTAVLACVDTMLGSRNGIAELWFKLAIQIVDYKALPDTGDENEGEKSSFSDASPIKLDKNWKDTAKDTSLTIHLNERNNIRLNLANTLFSNGESSTCFFVQPNDHPSNWCNLQNLSIELPDEVDPNYEEFECFNRLRELEFEEGQTENDLYQVTGYTSNMIESINDQPAATYLINNKEIQKSKRDLFIQLVDQNTTSRPFSTPSFNDKYYKITVGGLGWGEKQGMIVLDPIVGDVGYKLCRLFQYDPSLPESPPVPPEDGFFKIVAECSIPEHGFQEYHKNETGLQQTVTGLVGLGSERGFQLNGVWHKSYGETLQLSLKQSAD